MTTLQLGKGASVEILASAAQTGGHCSVVLGIADAGIAGPPLHRHTGFAEVYVVLEGRIALRRGDELLDLGPGDSATIPAGIAHAFRSAGPGRARWINVFAPGGFEGYFEEAADALAPDTPLDPAVLAKIASRYGLELVESMK